MWQAAPRDVLAKDQEHLQGPFQKALRSPRERGKTDCPCVLGSVCMHERLHMRADVRRGLWISVLPDVCVPVSIHGHTHVLLWRGSAVTGCENAGRGPEFKVLHVKTGNYTHCVPHGTVGRVRDNHQCSGRYSACHRERAPKHYCLFESVWVHWRVLCKNNLCSLCLCLCGIIAAPIECSDSTYGDLCRWEYTCVQTCVCVCVCAHIFFLKKKEITRL